MKQGRFLTWLITFILFAGVSLYMCLYIFDAFTNPFRTVGAQLADVEEIYSAAGFFVRDETPVPTEGGIFDVILAEGERAGKGQLIATTYADSGALEVKTRLAESEKRIAELEFAAGYSVDAAQDALKLDGEIIKAVTLFAENSDAGDPAKTLAGASALRSMVFKKEFAIRDAAKIEARLSELRSGRDEMKAQLRHASKGVYARFSGYFSLVVDGYEEILSPKALDEATVQFVDALPSKKDEPAENEFIGKMIDGYKWFFLTTLSEEDAKWITPGRNISVRFGRDYTGVSSVYVERKGEPENGRVVLILSGTRGISDISSRRRQDADIIKTSYTGIKIPKEALRISKDGSMGVYCVVAMQARLKNVEIIFEKDNYYLAAYAPEEDGALRPGDEIIVAARDLEDGKVISRG